MQGLVIIFSLFLTVSVKGLDNGLVRTPPMGWLSWERFRCNTDCKNDPDNCISEKLYKTMADLLVSEGYKDVGYEYINIDDCWMAKERDSQGKLVPDPERFPSGIKALADYMHSKGLKLGIYEDFGSKTCGGFPGSEFYMMSDANTFAEWNVDMLKFDGCYSDPKQMEAGFKAMGQFLNNTGHPMVYSCEWPLYQIGDKIKPDYGAIRETCNLWRNFGDVQDSWTSILSIIDFYGKDDGNFSSYNGPGGWNDPDMLVAGDFGLSYEEEKTQFVMWSMWSSPLFMSNDLRKISNHTKQLLQHKGILAINQDPLGAQAVRQWQISSVGLWLKPLAKNGSYAVAIVNRDDQGMPHKISVQVNQLGLSGPAYNFTEVFDNKFYGHYKSSDQFTVEINPLGAFLAIATPTDS